MPLCKPGVSLDSSRRVLGYDRIVGISGGCTLGLDLLFTVEMGWSALVRDMANHHKLNKLIIWQ